MESTTRNLFEEALKRRLPDDANDKVNLLRTMTAVTDLMHLSDKGYRDEVIKVLTDVISYQGAVITECFYAMRSAPMADRRSVVRGLKKTTLEEPKTLGLMTEGGLTDKEKKELWDMIWGAVPLYIPFEIDLIGREAYGVGFLAERYPLIGFDREMDKYIGLKGVISGYSPETDSIEITFYDDVAWHYPAELILRQFV